MREREEDEEKEGRMEKGTQGAQSRGKYYKGGNGSAQGVCKKKKLKKITINK